MQQRLALLIKKCDYIFWTWSTSKLPEVAVMASQSDIHFLYFFENSENISFYLGFIRILFKFENHLLSVRYYD
jgi:hypothetical protein